MKVLYFAWLRAKTGLGEEVLDPPAGVDTVGRLIEHLRTRSPGHAAAFAEMGLIRMAVNQDYAGLDTPVGAADEVAFFPPVTGG
jgi:molybdopterin converting factor subunit 1